jgi:2-desacetyl-2-hydroxyethyl bacteriochlorophyllide A dehydrogenase
MLALLLDGAPRLVRDHRSPERAPGEALVCMRWAGVCDTDLQLARGYMGYRGVLGHEFVGQVLEADGEHWIGRRVVADINAGCGACADCRERDGHHCSARSVLGILGRDGAFAERLVVPERCLVEVPNGVPDELAVFAEPLAAALHVLDAVKDFGAPIVVLGDGKLGLLIALALSGAGADVTVVGHHAEKLALAARAGAHTVLESELECRPRDAAVVVEATGSPRGLARALELVRPRGTVVLKTTVAGAIEVNLSPIVIDEIEVIGSRCGNMARAVELLAGGQLDPSPLITARYSLEQAEVALERAAERGTLKVLIEGKG